MPVWVDLVDIKTNSPSTTNLTTATTESAHTSLKKKPKGKKAAKKEPLLLDKSTASKTRATQKRQPGPRPITASANPLEIQPGHDMPLVFSHRGNKNSASAIPAGHKKYFVTVGKKVYEKGGKEICNRNFNAVNKAGIKAGTAIVQITISSNGALASLDLLQSSGMILLDYEALEVIKRAAPFRPPPHDLLENNKENLIMSIKFNFL